MMETYKQEEKERSRELLWEHAVKSLTQERATSRVLREDYLDSLWTFVKNRFTESDYLDPRELSDRKFEDWKRFGEQEYGIKKPEELKSSFLLWTRAGKRRGTFVGPWSQNREYLCL